LEPVQCINFTDSRSGALLSRTPFRTFHSANRLACAAHPALPPPAGCESHDSSPLVCAGSKLNTHPLHPQRAAASRAAAGVPHAPMRLVGPSPSHRRSRLPARRRTARDSLNGIRRSRAALMLSRHELSRRALSFGCTFGFTCRGPWMCVVVVSSRASESVVVCTCVFRTDLICQCVIHVSCYQNYTRNTQTALVSTLLPVSYTLLCHAGRRCPPSWIDADETWSFTGALGVMAAALPARAGLGYLLTAVRQALKQPLMWPGRTQTFSEPI
jgi:hypothetical protein